MKLWQGLNTYDMSYNQLKKQRILPQFEDLCLDGIKPSIACLSPPTKKTAAIQTFRHSTFRFTALHKGDSYDPLRDSADISSNSSFLPHIPRLNHSHASAKLFRKKVANLTEE